MTDVGAPEPLEFDERLIAWTSSTMRRLDLQYMDMEVHGIELTMDGPTARDLALVLPVTWSQKIDAVIAFPDPEEWGASAHVRLEDWGSGRTVHHCDYAGDESTWNLVFGTVSLYVRTRHRPMIRFSSAA